MKPASPARWRLAQVKGFSPATMTMAVGLVTREKGLLASQTLQAGKPGLGGMGDKTGAVGTGAGVGSGVGARVVGRGVGLGVGAVMSRHSHASKNPAKRPQNCSSMNPVSPARCRLKHVTASKPGKLTTMLGLVTRMLGLVLSHTLHAGNPGLGGIGALGCPRTSLAMCSNHNKHNNDAGVRTTVTIVFLSFCVCPCGILWLVAHVI